jgi:hypothetical protein
MNLAGLPVETLYEQLIYPQMQRQVGCQFKIAHLKSEKGKALNGKTCKITGFDRNEEARLHCKIGNAKKPISVKWQNLIPLEANEALENFMSASAPLSDDILLPCLERAIEEHDFDTDRQDLRHRVNLYKGLAQKIRDGTTESADYCLPCGAGSEQLNNQDNFGRIMQMMKPGCFGNEICDLRYIDIGLKGDDHTECPVCQEVLVGDTKLVVVTLPCLHVFHKACIQDWLQSDLGQENWNCPSCRHPVPGDMSIYCIEHNEQLQRRIDEYPLSGFCTRCMIMIMECNRHQPMPVA